MSSSPGLPSPSQLFSTMPFQLPTGSRATPIPKDAAAGFASASTLLRQIHREDESGSRSTAERLGLRNRAGLEHGRKTSAKSQKAELTKDQKNAATFKTPKVLLLEEPVSAHSNLDPVKVSPVATVAKAIEVSTLKKPRKKKSKEDSGQTKMKKPKITKPGASKPSEKSEKQAGHVKKPMTKVIETFNTLLPSQEEDARAREEFRDLCLEKAVPLRRGWTPCKDSVQDILPGSPPGAQFGHLLVEFGLKKLDGPLLPKPNAVRQETGEAPFKRRKVEVVTGIPVAPQIEKPKRVKSPKKKPQTITEKATAPFITLDPTITPSLLQYFSPPDAPEALARGQAGSKKPHDKSKPSVERSKKPKNGTSKAKKATQPVLLSPESAMKNMGDQEMLFGTSSQLAREDSPTCIKNIQQAVEESLIMSQEWGSSALPAGRFRTSNSLALARSRNLWSVASRDVDGSLFEAETVDLTETPKAPKTRIDCTPAPVALDVAESPLDDGRRELRGNSILEGVSNRPNLNLEATPGLPQEAQGVQEPVIARSVAEATLRKRPNNRSPVKNVTHSKSDPNSMPNYQGFTDAQLSKEVAAYGFKKSVKKRVAMITLLEQCWEAKVSLSVQEAQANLNPSQPTADNAGAETSKQGDPAKKRGRPQKNAMVSATTSNAKTDMPSKKPRSRPRKDTTDTATPPKRKRKICTTSVSRPERTAGTRDEIYDSSPPTPSPPRRRSSKSPGKLQLSPPIRSLVNNDISPSVDNKRLLFEKMTKAITTFPPTHDPKNLTFYEKILMYEPVVLEDLAAWLNTQGLARVGEDDEVPPGLVKDWCEERSVCCLWRENLRGGSRARY